MHYRQVRIRISVVAYGDTEGDLLTSTVEQTIDDLRLPAVTAALAQLTPAAVAGYRREKSRNRRRHGNTFAGG